jgi:DNA-binding transcriptional ArsR family regulator
MVKYRTLDGTFGALADPTRRGMVMQLAKGETSVSDLARPYGISLPAVSKHLTVLEQAGLIFRERRGRVFYCRLATQPLHEIDTWLAQFRRTHRPIINK